MIRQTALVLFLLCTLHIAHAAERPNILFISVDDMNCDSVGAFGCELPETTPNIDRLAGQGMRFEYAHVQVGNCMPSRNIMFSGLYSHNNRVEGFYQVPDASHPHLCDLMKDGGYFTAIRGKVSHSTPYHPYAWDLVLDEIDGEKLHIKNIESYYKSTQQGISAAKEAGKPFCLLINVSDPHKPFYAMNGQQKVIDDANVPSKVFTPDEVPIPGFLFDDPQIRLELAHYYSSVRRADDCVGATLKALEESGQVDDTVVVFLSDHGMPLPFAKTALYHHSTRTPWIVRWPEVVAENAHETDHMISAVDLLPTLLDIAHIEQPEKLDGRSFLPVLKGNSQDGREMVFKVYNENSGANRSPMRGVQTKRYGYLFNPWSDGERVFKTATTGTLSYRRMKTLAATNPEIAARLDIFEHAEPEQFFDYENDPDALHNLIDDPRYQDEINRLRSALEGWMVRTNDHALEAFRNRDSREALDAYVDQVQAEATARRNNRKLKQKPRQRKDLIRFRPTQFDRELRTVHVEVEHTLPRSLNTQKLHVTLKDSNQKRLERIVVEIQAKGTARIAFALPQQYADPSVSLAAFVGEEYQESIQHITANFSLGE